MRTRRGIRSTRSRTTPRRGRSAPSPCAQEAVPRGAWPRAPPGDHGARTANALLSGLLLLQHHGGAAPSPPSSQVCGEGRGERLRDGGAEPLRGGGRHARRRLGLAFYGPWPSCSCWRCWPGAEARAAAAALAFWRWRARSPWTSCCSASSSSRSAPSAGCASSRTRSTRWPSCSRRLRGAPSRASGEGLRRPAGRAGLRGLGRGQRRSWPPGCSPASPALRLPRARPRRGHAGRSAAGAGGAPAAAPLATPAPGSDAQRYQEEARAAPEQARRLQDILDDPRKLDGVHDAEGARAISSRGRSGRSNLAGDPLQGPGGGAHPRRRVLRLPLSRSAGRSRARSPATSPQSANRV